MNKAGQSESSFFSEAEKISMAGVAAVMPGRLIRDIVVRERREGRDALVVHGVSYDLDEFERVFLIAFGKAAPEMAGTLAEILGDRLTGGIVVSPGEEKAARPGGAGTGAALEHVRGSHPLPDQGSVEGARRALEMARRAGEKDLVLVCISGGGSALLCSPAEGMSLEEKQRVTRALLRAGADIGELNTVRKHISAVKGGRLAEAAAPATVVGLVLSDVIGNDLGIIASGPTHWDPSTFSEARRVLEKYDLWAEVPAAVRDRLEKGIRGDAAETLKQDSPVFHRVRNFIAGDIMTALAAAKAEAERLGFETLVLTAEDKGEARKAAADYLSFLAGIACAAGSAPRPLCFLAGGELTVTVKGKGKGGRNTEFVLASLQEMRKGELAEAFCGGRETGCDTSGGGTRRSSGIDWLILSMGTDGIDGPTDAAGAWVDPATLGRVEEIGLDPEEALADNDSYTFFKKSGNLLVTGPTGTNVMDIRVFLLGRKERA